MNFGQKQPSTPLRAVENPPQLDCMHGILVTGATGFIGRHLFQPGNRALVRKPTGIANETVGDLLDPASLISACENMETVFHSAGYAHSFSSLDAESHWRINYEGTRNLATAAGKSGVRRFVFLSTVKAMAEPGDDCVDEEWPGAPATPYGRAKRAAEEAVLEAGAKYGMHVVNLRLAMVYGKGGRGNLVRMASGIRAGWFPPIPETSNRRSLVHVNDVVAATRLVANRPEANERTYIVADPRAYSGREIYDTIRATLAVPSAPPFRVPAWLFRTGAIAGDALGVLLRRSMPINSEAVKRLLASACYSPARIEHELGWRACIGLAEGLHGLCEDHGNNTPFTSF